MSYLVTIDDGIHTHSEEFDTLEEARIDFKATVEYYSTPGAPPQEFVCLESDDYETIYDEHCFEYDCTDPSTYPEGHS